MNDELKIAPIAYIYNDYTDSFGIPRQSGIAENASAKIIFTPEFRDENALRDIEQYSHLWLIWGFSENFGKAWSPTVRPPKLGGNKRVGVFATRSPFRPNSLGLSCVKLESVGKNSSDGAYLNILGADLKNGTPIYDIKPYLPYVDIKENAVGGFSDEHKNDRLDVDFPENLQKMIPKSILSALIESLSLDPRPQYQNDGEREYGFHFGELEIRFKIKDNTLAVTEVKEK